MTPEQIELVETTLDRVDLEAVTGDFYRRAFAGDPELSAMFTTDPRVQRERFAAELDQIVRSIRSLGDFSSTVRALGKRHRDYGVKAGHYRLMGQALVAAIAAALGPDWDDQREEAWVLAYNLTAETMMMGAEDLPATS
jgi:hemoglobin-like flavoprotein